MIFCSPFQRMCVPSFPFHLCNTNLGPLPNSIAVLVGKLGLVVGMATQQGISVGHIPRSLMLKEIPEVGLHLYHSLVPPVPGWGWGGRGGKVLLCKDCSLSPVDSLKLPDICCSNNTQFSWASVQAVFS